MSNNKLELYDIGRHKDMDHFRKSMGNRMKEERKNLNLTQEQMAEKLGISVKHYGGVERGNAGLSLENLVDVSVILGRSLDYIVKGVPETDGTLPNRIKEIYINSSEEKRHRIVEILEILNKF